MLLPPFYPIAPPPPPSNLRVEKALGSSVLLLSWQPPRLDGSSLDVTGYQLIVNGEDKNTASGAATTKVSGPLEPCDCALTIGRNRTWVLARVNETSISNKA